MTERREERVLQKEAIYEKVSLRVCVCVCVCMCVYDHGNTCVLGKVCEYTQIKRSR